MDNNQNFLDRKSKVLNILNERANLCLTSLSELCKEDISEEQRIRLTAIIREASRSIAEFADILFRLTI